MRRACRASRWRGSATSASAARPGQGGDDRPPGRDPARLEGLRPRDPRGDRPAHGGPDRGGAVLRRAGPQRHAGLDPPPARGALCPAGGVSRPPGQADRGDRPRGGLDHRRPGGGLPPAEGVDALGPDHRPAEGEGRPARRADGRLDPDRPPRRARPRPPPRPVRPDDASGRPDRPAPVTTSCSTRTAWGSPISVEILVRAVEAGLPPKGPAPDPSWTAPDGPPVTDSA